MRVRVFLRQLLFTLPGAPHVPTTGLVLEGELVHADGGGYRVRADAWYDERGRPLESTGPVEVLLPAAKVDHLVVLGA